MKSAVCVLLVALAVASSGCGGCSKLLASSSSAKGRKAEVYLGNTCGPGTTGFSTFVKVTDENGNIFDRSEMILGLRGGADVKAEWLSENKLNVVIPAKVDSEDIVLKLTKWRSIEIEYTSLMQKTR